MTESISQSQKGTAVKKVPGGKLLRIDVDYSTRIEHIKITGDFFLHPEDVICDIEDSLTGENLPINREKLIRQVESVLQEKEALLIGASSEDIISILDEALTCNSDS